MEQLFVDVAIVVVVATIFAYASRLLKQPLMPAYILTGLLIGPFCLGLIKDTRLIITFSEIGIAFLLFVVGLELDLKKLKDIGLVASVGGTLQILFLFGFGYFVAFVSHAFSRVELTYIGLILAFSSTMVVVKLMSDNKTLGTLHGRIVVGILLMEDIFAIIAISLLSNSGSAGMGTTVLLIMKAISVFAAAIIVSRYIFPSIFRFAAHSQELLFLMSITTCFVFSIIASYIGFSIAIGGFIAGITLANLPYNLEIVSRVKPLRDFFSTLFFVALGMQLPYNGIERIIMPFLIFLVLIIVLKPLITMAICYFFGYTKRTSFFTAISLPQISEFSLIIAAQGLMLGQVSVELASLAVMLAVVSMTWTTYLSKYDNQLYNILASKLTMFDRRGFGDLEYREENKQYDVVLIGYDRIGYSIANTMNKIGKSWLVVDYNPDVIKKLIKEKIHCVYGDISDVEILEKINLKDAHFIISTVPNLFDNMLLIKKIKHVNEKAAIFVTANKLDEALKLYDYGADYVILPHFLGGDRASIILEEATNDSEKIVITKLCHIAELKKRKELGHEHPRQQK
ncbi:MAG: cation:proton antiporter [Candidatus Woesearchaeota archaeon]